MTMASAPLPRTSLHASIATCRALPALSTPYTVIFRPFTIASPAQHPTTTRHNRTSQTSEHTDELSPERPSGKLSSADPICSPIAPLAQTQLHTPPPPSPTPPKHGQGSRLPQRYFDPSNGFPDKTSSSGSQGKPPDENRANLGRTLRILQDRLPTLLQSPLQQDILAPNISLHLFPSTHPHLPTVSGRVAYTAALWTSPIAWNRVPVVGNVKLAILSARMTHEPVPGAAPLRQGSVPEQLVVRWCTCGEAGHGTSHEDHRHAAPGTPGSHPHSHSIFDGLRKREGKHFSGLFIFQFDREGRILSHTIETVQGSGDWEKGMGAKFVGLTDWLLGGLGRNEPCPAFGRLDPECGGSGGGGRGGGGSRR